MSEENPITSEPSAGDPAHPPAAGQATTAAPELEKVQKERDDLYNRYLRAVADLDNYRRRVVREKDELRQFATRDLVEALLPVYENLGLAIASAQTATDPQVIAQGVTLVLEQFRAALQGKGVVEINPPVGADFDPHQHESLAHAPSADIAEEKIVQVVRVGFALNSRLIRPASVILSSGRSAGEAPPATES